MKREHKHTLVWPTNVEPRGKFHSAFFTDPYQPNKPNRRSPVHKMCTSEVAGTQLRAGSAGSKELSCFWHIGCVWWSSTAAPSCMGLAWRKYNFKLFIYKSDHRVPKHCHCSKSDSAKVMWDSTWLICSAQWLIFHFCGTYHKEKQIQKLHNRSCSDRQPGKTARTT